MKLPSVINLGRKISIYTLNYLDDFRVYSGSDTVKPRQYLYISKYKVERFSLHPCFMKRIIIMCFNCHQALLLSCRKHSSFEIGASEIRVHHSKKSRVRKIVSEPNMTIPFVLNVESFINIKNISITLLF